MVSSNLSLTIFDSFALQGGLLLFLWPCCSLVSLIWHSHSEAKNKLNRNLLIWDSWITYSVRHMHACIITECGHPSLLLFVIIIIFYFGSSYITQWHYLSNYLYKIEMFNLRFFKLHLIFLYFAGFRAWLIWSRSSLARDIYLIFVGGAGGGAAPPPS